MPRPARHFPWRVAVGTAVITVFVILLALQFRSDSAPFVAEDLNLSVHETDERIIVAGGISAAGNASFPSALTLTISKVWLHRSLVQPTKGATQACVTSVLIIFGANRNEEPSESLDTAFTEIGVSGNNEPILTNSFLDTGEPTRPMCVRSDQRFDQAYFEVNWDTTNELHGAQRSYYRFPLDELWPSVYVDVVVQQRNETGPVAEANELLRPTQQFSIALPGWHPTPHPVQGPVQLSRPLWQVQVASFALVGLILILVPLLSTLSTTEDFLAASIALVLAFWTVRQFLIGDQPIGGLLFDQLFIVGQFGIVASIGVFLLRRMSRKRPAKSEDEEDYR